jgi:hypothetical protein
MYYWVERRVNLLYIHLLTAILVYTDINDRYRLDSLIFRSFILLSNNPLSHSAQTLSINIVKYCEILSSWERLARGRRSPLSWKAPPNLLYRPDTSPGSDCARYSSTPLPPCSVHILQEPAGTRSVLLYEVTPERLERGGPC